jgi:metal-sulfur cluster biosynthetic enzyme
MMFTVEDVRNLLHSVADPCAIATGVPVDIVAMGLVQDISISGRDVLVELRLTSPFCMQIGLLTEQIGIAVGRLPGVGTVGVTVDQLAEWLPEMMDDEARDELRRVRPLPMVNR